MFEHKGYAKKFAKFNLRFGRGNGHLSFGITIIKLTAYYSLIREPFREIFGINLPVQWGFIGSFIYLFACYLVGLLDEKLGFWKQETQYNTEELNPTFKKMLENQNEIKKILYDKTNK